MTYEEMLEKTYRLWRHYGWVSDTTNKWWYHPDSGVLYCLGGSGMHEVNPARIARGKVAGAISNYEGRGGTPLGRIIWLIMHNQWPPKDMVVDHINGDPTDNRWINLRLATYSQNAVNSVRDRTINGSDLEPGVNPSRNGRAYYVQLRHNNQYYYGGVFYNKEEANKAARKLRIEVHGQFRRGSHELRRL